MAWSPSDILAVQGLIERKLLPHPPAIAELGCQFFQENLQPEFFAPFFKAIGVSQSVEQIKQASRYHVQPGHFVAKDVFDLAGYPYVSFDIDIASGAELFDLNADTVDGEYLHSFDLVTNLGTTEHVLNQANAFNAMHDLCKPGGYMLHHVPGGGYFDHGFVTYNPRFFTQLATANEYEILYFSWWMDHQNMVPVSDRFKPDQLDRIMNREISENYLFGDGALQMIFVKRTIKDFQSPVDDKSVQLP